MECREARELLSDELDGRLSPSDVKRLEEHVASCAACAKERSELASLRAAFRASPRVAAPAGFAGGVMSSLPKGRVRNLPRMLGWIAAVAAVVVVAVTLIPRELPSAARETAAAKAAPVAARRADRSETVLDEKAAEGPPPPESAAPPKLVAKSDARFAEADAKGKLEDEDGRAQFESKDAPSSGAAARTPAPSVVPPAGRAAAPQAEVVRYVVFRDAASADRFAKELASADAEATKQRKPAEATSAPPADAGGGSSGGGGGAPKVKREAPSAGGKAAEKNEALRDDASPSDVAKEAAFVSRRVVSRAPLPAAVADADLAAKAALAGGTLVPSAEAEKFGALLDALAPDDVTLSGTEAEAATAAKSPLATGAATRKKAAPPPVATPAPAPAAPPVPAAQADELRVAGRPPVIVVIVVLEPSAPAAGGKR